jgi:hypothetical protein
MNLENTVEKRLGKVYESDKSPLVRGYLKFMHTTIKKKIAVGKNIHRNSLDQLANFLNQTRTMNNRMTILLIEKHAFYLDKYRNNDPDFDQRYLAIDEDLKKKMELESIELDEEELALKAAEALLETIVEPI